MAVSVPGITQSLAEFSAGIAYDALPEDVLAAGKQCLLDTLGVALVGSREDATRMLLNVALDGMTGGSASVLGSGTRASPAIAAMVNGYAAHALDYDDTQHRLSGHMSAPVVPAALAVAELQHSSGKDLLAAYVAGFEVACRPGRYGKFANHLSHHGVHATGFLGHFGAAAAAGRLLRLNVMQMRLAFGIAGGFASGLVKSFGTMGKAQNASNAAGNGVLSAQLAARGFTASDELFDGKRNIFAITGFEANGTEIIKDLGQDFEITHNTLKAYACAGWRNPIIEACTLLAVEHKLKPSDVRNIEVWACVDVVTRLPNYSEPRTGLEAKFSAEYAAAVAVTDGAGGVAQFTDERVKDAALIDLTRRTKLAADEKLGPYQIRVVIHTADGRALTHFVPAQKGDPKNPLSWDELLIKFRANALSVLPKAQVERLVDMLGAIEKVSDVADLLALCRAG
jgi:2-methylcitrate dehydratase PrpD